jgi:hypothetical protein
MRIFLWTFAILYSIEFVYRLHLLARIQDARIKTRQQDAIDTGFMVILLVWAFCLLFRQ